MNPVDMFDDMPDGGVRLPAWSVPTGNARLAEPACSEPLWPLWTGWQDRLDPCPDRVEEGGRRTLSPLEIRPELGPEMRTNEPLVSYVTVVRNAEGTLARCLESVRAQTYPHVEHIVVDGASTDGTLDVIRRFSDGLEYYVSEPDSGMYDALNKAISLSRGDYICVLNADDWLEPQAATVAVNYLKGMPSKSMLLSGVYRHGRKGRVRLWRPPLLHPGFLFIPGRWCHNAIYATRDLCEAAGPYDTQYRIVADYKWVVQCLRSGVHCVYTSEPTLHFTEGGMSSDGLISARERLRVQREVFPCLTEEEAAMLCYCLTASLRELVPDSPSNVTCMLQKFLCRHADIPDFVLSLSLAMAFFDIHPADIPVSLRKRLSRRIRAFFKSVGKKFMPARRS